MVATGGLARQEYIGLMLVLAAIEKQASFPDTRDTADLGYGNTRAHVA